MTDDDIQRIAIPHLTGQFDRGLAILFTGAGFSRDARNIQGNSVLLVTELKRELWRLSFPDLPYDDTTSLQELFDYALIRHRTQLADLLLGCFTVDADSIPDWYARLFNLAWFRSYTLNVDDLVEATLRRHQLNRRLVTVSATTEYLSQASDAPVQGNILEVVHLNGRLSDGPAKITFSITQYAERLARQEPWYVRLASELLTHSFIFVGTQLDESPLWQHIELRRSRGRQTRELRPRSYLVTPNLNPAREAILADFNIAWLQMTASQLFERILIHMEAPSIQGRHALAQIGNPLRRRELDDAAIVSQDNPHMKTEYLLGAEPIWADIQTGRAISRRCDEVLWGQITDSRKKAVPGAIIVTGTAGSGKSTALMKMCLRLVAQGIRVGWADRELSLSPREIRLSMREQKPPAVVVIDDADLYGSEVSPLTREIASREPYPLLLLGIRSGRIDRVIKHAQLQEVPVSEFSMPPLEDEDIDALLDILESENRLGLLRGRTRNEQRHTFRDLSGRQLLVAMIKATSGKDLQEKAVDELEGLDAANAQIYGLVSLASANRIGLFREEIVFGTGDTSNANLNAVDLLIRRNLLRVGHDGAVYARHRLIAELVRDEIQRLGNARELIWGLAQIGASKVNPTMPRSARPWRILRAVTSHEFLLRSVGLEVGRNLYAGLEEILNWDYHYWLQRGSLEVESGSLTLARNFLDQAKALSPDDPFVDTERAYLWFSQACADPHTDTARVLADEARELLCGLISRYGDSDPYPFHVLGSQGLAWVRRGLTTFREKERYLHSLVAVVRPGIERHPRNEDLVQLMEAIKREHLEIAIPSQSTLTIPSDLTNGPESR